MTQDQAFNVLTLGKNVFLTGAAGSGKTHLLNRYIHWLKERGVEPAVTASTGIAAMHLGGQTIHSWSGIGIKDHLSSYDLDRISQNERLVKRFRATQVLIIDEVSMLSADTLDAVSEAVCAGLQQAQPFGGMQVVLCGDFFQLPPVSRYERNTHFAFAGDAWHRLDLHACYLHEQHRQEDEQLLTLLNAIRTGTIGTEHRDALKKCMGRTPRNDIPHLYTHNIDVDQLNKKRLHALPAKAQRYEMRSRGAKKRVDALKKQILAQETLELKVDAAVMFIKNSTSGTYMNGTVGTVTRLGPTEVDVKTLDGRMVTAEYDTWQVEEGDTVRAEVSQVPLRLAWAVTIHKSQGLTLDAAHMDLSKTFVPGQGYVALSRVKSLNGVYLNDVSEQAYERNAEVALMDQRFLESSARIEVRLGKTTVERVHELQDATIVRFGGHPPKKEGAQRPKKQDTYTKTLSLIREGMPLSEIARARLLTPGTVMTHLEHLLSEATLDTADISHLLSYDEQVSSGMDTIRDAFEASPQAWHLGPVYRTLNGVYTYDQLRFARLFLRPWSTPAP